MPHKGCNKCSASKANNESSEDERSPDNKIVFLRMRLAASESRNTSSYREAWPPAEDSLRSSQLREVDTFGDEWEDVEHTASESLVSQSFRDLPCNFDNPKSGKYVPKQSAETGRPRLVKSTPQFVAGTTFERYPSTDLESTVHTLPAVPINESRNSRSESNGNAKLVLPPPVEGDVKESGVLPQCIRSNKTKVTMKRRCSWDNLFHTATGDRGPQQALVPDSDRVTAVTTNEDQIASQPQMQMMPPLRISLRLQPSGRSGCVFLGARGGGDFTVPKPPVVRKLILPPLRRGGGTPQFDMAGAAPTGIDSEVGKGCVEEEEEEEEEEGEEGSLNGTLSEEVNITLAAVPSLDVTGESNAADVTASFWVIPVLVLGRKEEVQRSRLRRYEVDERAKILNLLVNAHKVFVTRSVKATWDTLTTYSSYSLSSSERRVEWAPKENKQLVAPVVGLPRVSEGAMEGNDILAPQHLEGSKGEHVWGV
ncbi:T. brucei spp.-specific protein [Trypanosoma brucei gambiense DAL972]|uniref:T. brucei spp.-specific protein n=2 Tax=Trypanosoma brucei TaxID=5691 RepID=C9ZPD8_TRYB9|nr:T. brucei spp.-specific protein [Trypanosoma brucei gambiense DAL972]RHW72667.1 hypothetical protein DPX39_050035200 [Trypanosoma brucei equiperdum]CBH11266.1 T. brucei spp.-specific protein [Trypanosoma brucei gambiense DAL972]|eukprot:XP_011773553.1 T. brucei spp.-specific protein [Trypanosoma brucei gambiense DAL972]